MKNSNIYYINDRLDKRTWTYIFGACCATTVFIPSFHNYRIWSFLGLGMTTYTAWYLTIAAFTHGQVKLFTTFFVFHLKKVNGVSLIWFNFVISGWGCDTFSSNKASAILHRGYKHTLHFWWPCCDCVSFIFLHSILSSLLNSSFHLFLRGFCVQLLPAILVLAGHRQYHAIYFLFFCLLGNNITHLHFSLGKMHSKNVFLVCILVFVFFFFFNHCEFFTFNS